MQIIKRNILIIGLLCLFPLLSFAQQLNMGGIVSDEDGPLPGVNVYLKGRATVGVLTDIDGKFKIKAQKGEVIVFSFIGYQTVEFLVDKQDEKIEVTMYSSATELEEVVVTGLGSTQRKISVVGAITTVDTKDLQVPATSLANMLGGRVAGVISLLASGEPGKNISEFWVRGIGTFGASNTALVLIDGLEGDINSIDPADVESFSVLKDASATAVYGVRGANGVILVTTKRGQAGRLKITGRANFTISHINRMPHYLRANDYARLANEARVVRNEDILYSDMELRLIQYHLDDDLYPDIDWQKEIMKKNSFQHTYYLNASGGAEAAKYFVSLGASIQDAAYRVAPTNTIRAGVGYNTYNFRLNLDINLTKNTTLYFGSDGYLSMRMEPGMANTDAMWTSQSMLTPLTVPIRYSTGELPSYTGNILSGGFSPYVLLNYTGKHTEQIYTGKSTLAIAHDLSYLLENLKVRVQGSYKNSATLNEYRVTQPEMFLATGRTIWGELQRSRSQDPVSPYFIQTMYQTRKFELESNVSWDKVIADDHRVGALVYYYMSDDKDTRKAAGASEGRSALEALPVRYQGLSGRFTYSFRDTYMIDFNFGYTGSENFEPGRQFGFFPSVAFGWVPTQYEWLNDQIGWLTHLKLRGSYGTVGNPLSIYRFPFMMIIGEDQGVGWQSTLNGVTELQFGANNLVWEKSVKADVGLEANLFNDRFTFIIDFFHQKNDDIFQRRETIPGYVGLVTTARPYGNVGSMRSYGSDGNFSFMQEINKDLSFTLRGNYTYSQNEIINWEQPPTRYAYQPYNGYPLYARTGYIATGLFADEDDVKFSATQSFGGFKVMPGDIKYKDINGDGVINSDDMVYLSDNSYPKFMYGIGGEVRYKNFTLGFMFKGTGKTDMYHVGYYNPLKPEHGTNGQGYIPFYSGRTGNVLTMVNDPSNRWVPREYAESVGIDPALAENPNAKFPRLSYGYNANNSQMSTFWRNDSRYVRLEEVTLNYNLRANFLKTFGMSSVDIQFVGSNLYVWSKIKDWDPEQGYRNGSVYPIPARYALQFYLNF